MIKNKSYKLYLYKNAIILMFLIIFYFCQYECFVNKREITNSLLKQKKHVTSPTSPMIHNYKLFNATDYPFISIIYDFSNSINNFIDHSIINFFQELPENLFIDIQIIILKPPSKHLNLNKNIKSIIMRKKLLILSFLKNNWKKSFLNLFCKVKSKFFILLDKPINIKEDQFKKIFEMAKGSIQDIINIYISPKDYIDLIRTKALKDIIDKENKFCNFKDIINYIYQKPINNFNFINIALCPDNYYTALAYTSMISILTTKNYYTYISFYLIISNEFNQKNINFIESLYEQFEHFNITFLKMDNRYSNAYSNRYITKNAFYRLSLGELLPNLDKIIYLDSDTIILKDLSNLYNLNFLGKVFIAAINQYKSFSNFSVNTGVLLLNLKEMREKKIEEKVLTLLKYGFRDNIFHDQAIINNFFKEDIGFISPSYNTFSFQYKYFKRFKIYR